MSSEPQSTPKAIQQKTGVKKTVLQIVFSLIALGCAAALITYYLRTPPKAKPRARTPVAPLVTVSSIQPQNVLYEFEAMGTVTSAQKISLTPRVSGEIIKLSSEIEPGGYVKKGDHIISIDPTDYEIAILQLQSDLAKVKSDLNLEMGSQRIAIKEYEILGQKVSPTEKKLMLREPQLGIAKAAVANAEAKLKRAKIDLARTTITAPFNGVILSKDVDLGSHVSPTTSIVQLAGTDRFWIKVNLPVEQLQWLDIPTNSSAQGSPVRIFLQEAGNDNSYRVGRVIRLGASLETEGRMAEVYVSVEDPLCLIPENRDKPQLLLGTFVRVSFTGKELNNVIAINRNQLHENDTVWLLTDDNTLDIKSIEVLARSREYIYTSTDLGSSPRLITSQISSPTIGTQLQLLEEKPTVKMEKVVE